MFEVGDVVCCVNAENTNEKIKLGALYKVTGFCDPGFSSISAAGNRCSYGVFLAGIFSVGISGSFDPQRFRKLPPAEPEFINLIRGLKDPTKIREDA